MIKLGKIYISLFTVALIPFYILSGAVKFAAISYLSLIWHELFHLFAAYKLKIKTDRIIVLPFGINININQKLSYISEILFCISGPFASFLLAFLFFSLKLNGFTTQFTDYIVINNLSLFIINVLPIYPLDGGRIFKRVTEEKTGYFKAAEISIWVSQFFVFLVCVFIFLTVLFFKFNISIMVLCCFLIYSISEQKKSAILTFSQLLIYSSQKLENSEKILVREIAASNTLPIKDVIKLMSDNMYVIITVTDKNGKIIARLSETELIKKAIDGKKYIYEAV